jgi:hypothetical protein
LALYIGITKEEVLDYCDSKNGELSWTY